MKRHHQGISFSQGFHSIIYRFPVITAAVLSFAGLSIASSFFHFTYGADDYTYLARVYSPNGLSLSSFGAFIIRVPLWSLLTWGLFHIARFLPIRSLIHITVFFYVIGFSMLSFHIFSRLTTNRPQLETAKWVFATITFAFFPNHYEILYWPTCMGYIPGLILMAIAIRANCTCMKISLFSLSFLTSEMYILPALAYELAPALIRHESAASLMKRARSWIVAVILFAGAQSFFSVVLGYRYHYDLIFRPSSIVSQLKTALFRLWTIHFYKTNGVLSFIYFAVLCLSIFFLLKGRTMPPRLYGTFLGMTLLVTIIYWFYGHQAVRALFGAQIFIVTVLIFIFSKLRSEIRYLLPVLFVVFLAQNFYVFSIKDKNFHVLQKRTAAIVKQVRSADDLKVIKIEGLGLGLKRDWILPPEHWRAYLDWINAYYFPNRQILFMIFPP